jgi:plastocyanin
MNLNELAQKGIPTMRTGVAATFACTALLLSAGCGSSSKATAGNGAGTTADNGAGTTAGTSATSAKAGATSGGGASIKVDTTPKFASPSKSAPVQSGVVQIAYRNIAIAPDTVRVKVGSTVKWTNYDSVQANVVSVGGGPYKFASKDFGEGGTYELKANKPGVIHYECTLYPVTMNGSIEVLS